eukprot:5530133-Pyramimonas_sp.AAC.1
MGGVAQRLVGGGGTGAIQPAEGAVELAERGKRGDGKGVPSATESVDLAAPVEDGLGVHPEWVQFGDTFQNTH